MWIVVASRTSSSYSYSAHILHALPKQMIHKNRIKEAERNILFLLPVASLSSYAFYMALISLEGPHVVLHVVLTPQ